MGNRSISNRSRAAVAALVFLSVAGISLAVADDADPPGRVARLSFTQGAVSMQPAGVEDWTDAVLNRPLTTGDKLWTDQDSRAELDFGSAVIRLGSTTGFSFLNLDDETAQMNVTAGTAIVHVRDLGEHQNFEIDTPNLAVTVQRPGDYRVEVNEAGDTTIVKVSNGEAEVSATGETIPVHTQQAVTFTGTDQVNAEAGTLGAPDSLDEWSLERDHHEEQAQSNQYVSPDVAGAEDLDDYGTWTSEPDYGYVWTPTAVAVGWAPYRVGHWLWVSPWGWTWVDAAPWGFAPFHYGRWAYLHSNWCWVPGPRRVRSVYAPAMVAWVGGAGAAVVVGGGAAVGWFPLGPREVYVPGYHASRNYVRNVNVSNTTIVNNTYITNVYENRVTNITYANRRAPGAVTTVSRTVFTSGQPVAGHRMQIPEADLNRFSARGAPPAIAPVRQSALGGAPNRNVRRPPAAFANRPVVARVAPPPAPVSFAKQETAIRANGGRPLARAQLTQLQPRTPNSSVRVVKQGPVRNLPARGNVPQPGAAMQRGGPMQPGPAMQRGGTTQPGAAPTLQERERTLHATPTLPSQQNAPPGQLNSPSRQNALRNDRPAPTRSPTPETSPTPGAPPTPDEGRSLRTDRPPPGQMRHNDQYRPQDRPVEPSRPTPEPRSVEPPHPAAQARPVEPPRPTPEPRMAEPPRGPEARAVEPPRGPQARAVDPQRPAPEARAVEPQRPEARMVEPPRPAPRQIEPPRPAPEPRAIAPPPPRPVMQPRPAPPPPARAEDHRTKSPPQRPDRDPRNNR